MPSIEQLLHRRTDLSTFLVHLTRDGADATARDNLLSMAATLEIQARSAMGPASWLERYLEGSGATQKVVCFTETPLEHTWMMVQDIDGRQVQFQPYGLVFTKTTARLNHCNPVWYTDISVRGGRSWPIDAVNKMVDTAFQASKVGESINRANLQAQPVFLITPFIEQMGPITYGRKEWWWEREWRRVGDFRIRPTQVVAFLVPEADHASFRSDLVDANPVWSTQARPLLDPIWGLERMIAGLADLDSDDIGPFPMA